MIRSSPKLQDLVPFIREKSETELFMKAIEIVCLARVWKSLEPIAQKKETADDGGITCVNIPTGTSPSVPP